MTADIHTCSYQCQRPACVLAQRDDLVRRAEADAAEIVRLRGEVESLRGQIHDEIAANLAFRAAGGAKPDEDMPTFCARLLAERDAAIAPAEAKGDALHPAQKALRKIRAGANEPGTRASHGEQFANGLRCAANILEEALNKAPQPTGGDAVAEYRAKQVQARDLADRDGRHFNAQGCQQAIDAIDFCVSALSHPPAAQVQQEAVAYLEIGSGGYLDLGTDRSDEFLLAMPPGRYALGVIGHPCHEAVGAALRFLGELESVGNSRAGEVARGLRKLATHPAAWDKVRELLAAGRDELIRRKLTSHSHKFAFAKERGLSGLVEVHAWMTSVADRFESALESAIAQPQSGECPSRHRCDCIGACKHGLGGNGAQPQEADRHDR